VFTVAPILFGLDKFANLMTHWPMYLAPWIDGILPGDAQTAMYIVGVIEIVAGILVAVARASVPTSSRCGWQESSSTC
jgi:hypothetical protein